MTLEQTAHTMGRHRARQVRACVVTLAQEYREACRQHEEISVYVFRLHGAAPEVLPREEERVWEGMEQRRAALFGALEELERLEGEGTPVTRFYRRLVEHARAASQSGATPVEQAVLLIADALRWVESGQARGAEERAALADDLARALGFVVEEEGHDGR